MANNQNKLTKFWQELKRRKVVGVIISYAVVAFVLLQLANLLEESFELPAWFDTIVGILLIIGFPIAVIFAWIFDTSEKGIIKTKKSGKPQSSEKPVKEAEKKYFKNVFKFRKAYQILFGLILLGALIYISWNYYNKNQINLKKYSTIIANIDSLYSDIESIEVNSFDLSPLQRLWQVFRLTLDAEKLMNSDTILSAKYFQSKFIIKM